MSVVENSLQLECMVDSWLATGQLNGLAPSDDAKHLGLYVQEGERLLLQLPRKTDRNEAQQLLAEAIHNGNRRMRERFMRSHVGWVYNMLTDNRRNRLRIGELAFLAAEKFPGLVPTREQIADEKKCIQAKKDAREIDQGIFFSAIFAHPESGRHLIESQLLATGRAKSLLVDFRQHGRIDLDKVSIERRGNIAFLTVRNESCLNAEDNQLAEDMETAVDLALLDDSVRVGVLRGCAMVHPKYVGRRVFSAGINLRDLHHGQISYVDFLLRRELTYISKIYRGLLLCDDEGTGAALRLEKPWVAAVDAFAIGGGAQLLMVFDRVIASADSYLSLPAAQEGIVPGVANLRLNRAVGPRLARQVILFGRKIWAHEPEARMLVDEVVEPLEMDAAIERSANSLDSPAVVANRHILVAAEEPLDSFREYMAGFARVQAERLYSPDVMDKVSRA